MRKHEILYDWPIAEISRLADSDIAEGFAASLVDPALSLFTSLTEQIRGLGANLDQAKAECNHFSGWGDLQRCLESFESQFSTFPEPSFGKFRLFAILAEKLVQMAEPLDAAIVDENKFEIRELQNSLPLSWFSKENIQSFEDSVAIFSCNDFVSLESEIYLCNISPPFIFHILSALVPLANVPTCHAVLIKKVTPTIETAAIDAFVRIVILASGKTVHSPRRYAAPLSVINPDIIRAGHLYQQWNEIFYVLSEYNSRDEILLKFLTIYHVVENLMFKFPIVELERQNNGRMFSIRDFRRLYQQVDETESAALKRLFAAVLKEEATPGILFEARLVTRWQNLPTASITDIENALGTLGIKKSHRPLRHSEFGEGNECAGHFTKLVYQTRCAIVHNKETEFHLTYASLDAAFALLLENFLIPSLEEICFALIGSPNQKVWYSGEKLLLY